MASMVSTWVFTHTCKRRWISRLSNICVGIDPIWPWCLFQSSTSISARAMSAFPTTGSVISLLPISAPRHWWHHSWKIIGCRAFEQNDEFILLVNFALRYEFWGRWLTLKNIWRDLFCTLAIWEKPAPIYHVEEFVSSFRTPGLLSMGFTISCWHFEVWIMLITALKHNLENRLSTRTTLRRMASVTYILHWVVDIYFNQRWRQYEFPLQRLDRRHSTRVAGKTIPWKHSYSSVRKGPQSVWNEDMVDFRTNRRRKSNLWLTHTRRTYSSSHLFTAKNVYPETWDSWTNPLRIQRAMCSSIRCLRTSAVLQFEKYRPT